MLWLATISAGATISSTALRAGGDQLAHRGDRGVDAREVKPGAGRAAQAAGTVSKTASATKPSVPSEPTSRRRKISTGVVGVEERAEPVAGRVLDLELARGSARRARRRRGSRSRISSQAARRARARRRRSGPRRRGRRCRSPCPRAARRSARARSGRSRSSIPQRIPPELLAITPPTQAISVEAGSGPSRRPCGASSRFACPSTVPGRTRARAPSASIATPRQ